MTPEIPFIDYHALALAQVDVFDNEADKIAASIPEELRGKAGGYYEVPARGSMNGAARLEKAREIQARAEREVTRVANEETQRQHRRANEDTRRAESNLKQELGLPIHQPLPVEFTDSELREWAKWLRENPTQKGRFAQELTKRKANARAVAGPSRPTMF